MHGKPRVAAGRQDAALPAPGVLRAGSLSGLCHAAAAARSSPASSTNAARSQSPELGHLLAASPNLAALWARPHNPPPPHRGLPSAARVPLHRRHPAGRCLSAEGLGFAPCRPSPPRSSPALTALAAASSRSAATHARRHCRRQLPSDSAQPSTEPPSSSSSSRGRHGDCCCCWDCSCSCC